VASSHRFKPSGPKAVAAGFTPCDGERGQLLGVRQPSQLVHLDVHGVVEPTRSVRNHPAGGPVPLEDTSPQDE
jgi:hypothetical protein